MRAVCRAQTREFACARSRSRPVTGRASGIRTARGVIQVVPERANQHSYSAILTAAKSAENG
jgi:hypothetical protein